ELQPGSVGLDDRDTGTIATLETFAAVEPGVERRKCPRQRLDLADPAASIRSRQPKFAILVFAREIILSRANAAHVAQTEQFCQRVAIGKRLLEQPAGVEKDHRNRGI